MKKTLIALAVLGSVAGVAQAQSAVTIYGVLDAGITKATGNCNQQLVPATTTASASKALKIWAAV